MVNMLLRGGLDHAAVPRASVAGSAAPGRRQSAPAVSYAAPAAPAWLECTSCRRLDESQSEARAGQRVVACSWLWDEHGAV